MALFFKYFYEINKKIIYKIINWHDPFFNNNKKLIKYRYIYIQNFSKNLINNLGINKLTEINLAENISYKLAGYNANLDWFLKNFILTPNKFLYLFYLILNFIYLKKKINNFLESNRRDYEIKELDKNIKKNVKIKKYDNIYFASMNNYLNPIIPDISRKKNSILIIPAESKKWLNYPKIKKKGINFVFLEELINFNHNIYYYQIKEHLIRKYQKYKSKILKFKYNFSFKEPLIKQFIFDFLPIHILIVKSLTKFLKKISSSNTNFYIARDRRALENAFIQIAKLINGNTNILMHGMISLNFNKRLWHDGRFENAKNVFVWGEHDKDVIIKKQELLKKRIPKIIIIENPFLKKISHIRGTHILILCQKFTNEYIPYFSKKIKIYNKVIVRLHPNDKNLIPIYKKFRRKNFIFDDLKENLSSILSRAILVISFSSTSILEALINEIPTLILDFNKLKKKYTSIFKEIPIEKKFLKPILLTKRTFNKKIKKTLFDEIYKEKVLSLNKKLLRYFIFHKNLINYL
ncbi:MAG: hypothetical protein ACTSVV_06635 [Promethearchaeota archaeon]